MSIRDCFLFIFLCSLVTYMTYPKWDCKYYNVPDFDAIERVIPIIELYDDSLYLHSLYLQELISTATFKAVNNLK
jgi:hypothetical protein